MGAEIARTIAQAGGLESAAHEKSFNFNKGFVHKLIALDSPFSGSRLAARLAATNPGCKLLFLGSNMPIGGAVTDLIPGSAALTALNNGLTVPIPTVAIIGTASGTQTAVADNNAAAVKIPCPGVLPTGGFADVFGEPSDLIVGASSQAGIASGAPPQVAFPGFVHSVDSTLFTNGPDILSRNVVNGQVVGVPTGVVSEVLSLLNQRVSSAFGPIRP
jgi:hypothetical protein